MFIYQSKVNLDEKILFGNFPRLIDPEIRQMLEKGLFGDQDSTPGEVLIYFSYGDVPLNRVSFLGFRLRDRVSFL